MGRNLFPAFFYHTIVISWLQTYVYAILIVEKNSKDKDKMKILGIDPVMRSWGME